MMICNDRRWPESYREMGLQGVEMILCGYNTPIHYAPDPSQDQLQGFHNTLVMQSGAYQNGTFVVGVAKGGVEEGVPSLAESVIIAPSGEILAEASTDRRRADLGRLRPRLVPAVHRHPVRHGPLPTSRGVHAADHHARSDPVTDPWSRDAAPEPSRGPVFEIPLEGDGPLIEQHAAATTSPRELSHGTGAK